MQRSANNACLAEAKSWMNSAVSNFAIDGSTGTFPTAANKACAVSASSGEIATPTQGVQPSGTAITAWSAFKGDLYFAPPVRGALSEFKIVKCSTNTSGCELVA